MAVSRGGGSREITNGLTTRITAAGREVNCGRGRANQRSSPNGGGGPIVTSVAKAIGIPQDGLCQACITCEYPTPTGQQLYQLDAEKFADGDSVTEDGGRAFDLGQPSVGSA